MLNRETAIKQSTQIVDELRANGYIIPKVILFGSMVNNSNHNNSDIDLAVWDSKFTGCLPVDYEPIKHILSRFVEIELHTFNLNDNRDNNPFVGVIENKGLQLV